MTYTPCQIGNLWYVNFRCRAFLQYKMSIVKIRNKIQNYGALIHVKFIGISAIGTRYRCRESFHYKKNPIGRDIETLCKL